MTLVLHAGFILAVLALGVLEWRWIAGKSRLLGLIVGVGVAVRLVTAITSFTISYFDAGILRGLHTGGGFWTLALDARLYYDLAWNAAATSPFSIPWTSTSPAYTIALACWMRATGSSVLSAILFNIACYLVTAVTVVVGTHARERRPADDWTPIVLAAFTFSPVLVLTGTQVLKDPFFTMLIALVCRTAFVTFDSLKRGPGRNPIALPAAFGASVILVTIVGGVRAYFAVLLWLAFAAGFGALVFVEASSTLRQARRALLGLAILAGLWVAFAVGSGPYYSYYRSAVSSAGVAGEIETSRASFIGTGGATNMATGEDATSGGDASPSQSTGRKLATGLLAIFVPMSILKAASIVSFAGGRGLIFVADLDTIFLDAMIVLLVLTVVRRRPPVLSNAPALMFCVTLFSVSALLLAYVVTNFGTLLRLRLLVAATAWFSSLAFSPRLVRLAPVAEPADARLGRFAQPMAAGLAGLRRRMPQRPESARLFAGLAIVAFLAMLFAPGAPDSVFSGSPLTRPALACLTAGLLVVALAALVRPRRPVADGWIVGLMLLAMLKAAMAFGTAPSGWQGTYEVFDQHQSSPLSFLDGLSNRPYRIDRDIDFDGPSFKLPLVSDGTWQGPHRGAVTPDVEFAMRIRWVGITELAERGPLSWSVRCRGLLAISVDGKRVVDKVACSNTPMVLTTPPLSKGSHKVLVSYQKPEGLVPLTVVTPANTGTISPLRRAAEISARSARLTVLGDVVGWIACGFFVLAIGWAYWPATPAPQAWGAGWPSRAAALGVTTLLLGLSLRLALSHRGVTAQVGADDALTFETQARDAIFNGFHVGHGQTLYTFALAGVHLLFGEDLSGPVFLNAACLAALVPIGWWMGWRHLRRGASIAAAVIMGAFCAWCAARLTATTTDDLFFLALTTFALGATVRALNSGTWARWLIALVAIGASVATRATFAIFPILLVILLAGRRRPSTLVFGRVPETIALAWGAFVTSQVAVALSIAGPLTSPGVLPLAAAGLLGLTLLLPRRPSQVSRSFQS